MYNVWLLPSTKYSPDDKLILAGTIAGSGSGSSSLLQAIKKDKLMMSNRIDNWLIIFFIEVILEGYIIDLNIILDFTIEIVRDYLDSTNQLSKRLLA
jgi:hypothetical protein